MFNVFTLLNATLNTRNLHNFILRLNNEATVIVLIAFSLVATSRQYIDEQIDCIVENVPGSTRSTFTIANRLATQRICKHVPYPETGIVREGDDIRIIFVLLFQALLFYIPHYSWENWKAANRKSTQQITEEDTHVFCFLVLTIINILNVLFQIYFVNWFVGENLTTYENDIYEGASPMMKVSLFLQYYHPSSLSIPNIPFHP
jgi:Innexin